MSFPDKQIVLDFLKNNPNLTTKQEIARGLGVKGRDRDTLRDILTALEDEGVLARTGRRAFAPADRPPPSGLVEFEKLDADGDLIGRAVGDNGLYGPPIYYKGARGKRGGKAPAVGDRAVCKISEYKGTWIAHVVTLLEKRLSDRLVGIYQKGVRGGRVVPSNRKERREFQIQDGDRNGAEDGDIVIAEPKPDARRSYGPLLGVVKEVVGHIGDARSASLLAITAHGIPVEFPDDVMAEAKAAKPADVKREDLTRLPLITIDPADARDHDDAVFAEKTGAGWRVIVAIADVAAYVTEGSALDREAFKRGNSTYFPDRVVPMLPFELSADACSLLELEPRPCLAVEMMFSAGGKKTSHRFIRGTMRSAAKLSYEEAQAAIDGKPGGKAEPLLETVLKPLWGAYAATVKAREDRSPLDLDMPERRIQFDAGGDVSGITTKARFDAHRLIEEFMIQANVCAAESLETARTPLVYRVHDVPTDTKLLALAEFLQTLDMKWALGERPQTHRFNDLLKRVADTEHEGMVNQIVLRTQAQAIYTPENIGHFGLNLMRYAHFTSPIRRYADLVVHRALIRALGFGPDGMSDGQAARLDEIAEHISMTERRSMAAEREATDRYLAIFLADRVGAEFDGRITGVTPSGLFISLAGIGADGFVPISSLSDDYWVHDAAAMAVYARRSGRTFGLGQIVRVRLREVTPIQGGILLEVISDPAPAPENRKSARADLSRDSSGGRRPPPRNGRPKFDKKTLPKHKRKRGK